ncbi:YppG family protein [Streptomyces werraensis]|uniref:YppG family protein n=1 Tax=Streptomyces werraensis TaxID=68284 RepID=UPI001CE3042E
MSYENNPYGSQPPYSHQNPYTSPPPQGEFGPPQYPSFQPPAPYGQPSPPGPRPKNKQALFISLALAAVAALGALVVLEVRDDDKASPAASEASAPAPAQESEKTSDSPSAPAPEKHRITPALKIAEYQRTAISEPAPDSNQKATAAEMGVSDPEFVVAEYHIPGGESLKEMSLNGISGDVSDPEKAIDKAFANYTDKADGNNDSGVSIEPVGTPEEYSPAGFEALMKCQMLEAVSMQEDETVSARPFNVPTCIWSDSSGVAVVNTVTLSESNEGDTLDEVADIAAEHYAKSRSKVA